MTQLFGIDIADIVAREIGPGLIDCVVTIVTKGDRKSNPTEGRDETTVLYEGKGLIKDYSDSRINGTIIKQGDREVLLIVKSFDNLPVPTLGSRITIEGSTYRIVGPVKRDPASATYKCQVRL